MRFAVDFDHQAASASIEIDNIGSNRMLSPHLKAQFLAAKLAPQNRVGQAHCPAQLSCKVDRRLTQRRAPSTSYAGSLPRAGEDHCARSTHAAHAALARSRTRPI